MSSLQTEVKPQAPQVAEQRDTRPRPQTSRRPKKRFVRLVEPGGVDLEGNPLPALVAVTVGREPEQRYLVAPLEHPELPAYSVCKLPLADDAPVTTYHTVLGGDSDCSCTCLGWERWGRPCRHIQFLRALRWAGRLA
jgi:hypothetical protein